MTTSDSGFNILSNLETVVSNADQGIVISKLLKHATIIQKIFENGALPEKFNFCFRSFFASINEIFILAGRLGNRKERNICEKKIW